MKKYSAQTNHWKESKALGFFLNFINNHKGTVNDNDTFALVASLRSKEEWIDFVRAAFSEQTITQMEESRDRMNRLDFDDECKEIIRNIWNAPYAQNRLRKELNKVAEAALRQYPVSKSRTEPFARKVRELQTTMKLTDFEVDVLLIFAFVRNDLLCISDGHSRHSDLNDKQIYAAKCLDCDIALVREALRDDHKLRRYGCVDEDFDFNSDLFGFLCGVSNEPLAHSYYTRCREEALPWGFYGGLADRHGDMLKRIISSGSGSKGTNILLYGAPGTGKSSFAKTLAAELKRDCYQISQNVCGNGGRGPARSIPEYRFGALQICAEQVDPASSLIIVDEADEMLRGRDSVFAFLTGGNRSAGDKGLLNSVLDSVRVPTIWITNTPADALDESSRRRFDYSIRFDPLNTAQRLAIWRNNVAKMKLGHLVDDAMQSKFAALYPVSAGGITLTLENLVKLSPKPSEVESLVEKLMAPHCELLGIPKVDDKLLPARDYSLEGLNIKGSLSLDRIVEAIRNYQEGRGSTIDRPRMNLLLSGAPGTGKTEFVKYLGSVLNTKVIVKMGSDLLDMYVGGTERNIRCAFEEAEAEKAILFLDEIDGLVQNRERAVRSWEVTQVNELLHRMENFGGVMIGATNFSANLDSAILRRFTFKLEFDYLDDVGKKLFFERMFGATLTSEETHELAEIPTLAPGDFRTVRQSFFYLGTRVNNRDYLDALARESEVKSGNRFARKTKIGF